jgi:nucleoside-diphosphate-sugar epimerase
MNICVIGGTGFIGYHLVNALTHAGHNVRLLSRSREKPALLFAQAVAVVEGDLSKADNIDYTALFNDCDALFYCAGIDERVTPDSDPYTFFYKENVTTCIELLEKAKQHNIRHALVCGSIFTYIDRLSPEIQLAEQHAYIRSRKEQAIAALALSDENFQVNIMEIPFVFGKAPNCQSVWHNIVNYLRISDPILATQGGTNVISVTTLAQALLGAALHLKNSGFHAVGDQNMTWRELLQALNHALGNQPKRIKFIDDALFADLTKAGALLQDMLNMKTGLCYHNISKLITYEAHFDTQVSKQLLQYKGGDIQQAFRDTVETCPAPPLIGGLEKSLLWFKESQQYFKNL